RSERRMDQRRSGGEVVLEWARFVLFAIAIALIGLSSGVGWPLRTVSALFQGFGVLLTMLGLAAIGDRLRHTAEQTAVALAGTRRRAAWWRERRREQLAAWWARIRRRPRPAIIHAATATATASASGNLTVSVQRNRVDRSTVSDRDWLAFL